MSRTRTPKYGGEARTRSDPGPNRDQPIRPPERNTRQRQLVLEVVQASDDHPTAAQVFQRVRRRYPGVAYATIYNSLRWWVEHGTLREFTFGDAATRYDRNRDRHDHAICQRCGRLLDVSVKLPRKLIEEVRRRTGLHVQSHHVQFLGLCGDCAPASRA